MKRNYNLGARTQARGGLGVMVSLIWLISPFSNRGEVLMYRICRGTQNLD